MKSVVLSASALSNSAQLYPIPADLLYTVKEAARARFNDPCGPEVKARYKVAVVEGHVVKPVGEDARRFAYEHQIVFRVSRG